MTKGMTSTNQTKMGNDMTKEQFNERMTEMSIDMIMVKHKITREEARKLWNTIKTKSDGIIDEKGIFNIGQDFVDTIKATGKKELDEIEKVKKKGKKKLVVVGRKSKK